MTGQDTFKGTKKIPLLLSFAVILPGLIISMFGINLVSQQKTARILNLKKTITNRLVHIQNTLENDIRNNIRQALNALPTLPKKPSHNSTLHHIKTILLQNPIVKYPFIIDSRQRFLFPFPGLTPVSQDISPTQRADLFPMNSKMERSYSMAYRLEYSEKAYITAIVNYLKCLEANPRNDTKSIIYNAVGRCYFKQKLFPQAIEYYFKALFLYRGSGEKNKKDSLYFTLLRQLALSYKGLDLADNAAKYYLELYERIQQLERAEDQSEYALYKNEALHYLNRHIRSKPDNPPEYRSLLRQLGRASQLDVSLRWEYFDEPENETVRFSPKERERFKFLKLRELHEANDEKTQFYKIINKSSHWRTASSRVPSLQLKHLEIPGYSDSYSIAFKPIETLTEKQTGMQFFGFLISRDFIIEQLLAGVTKRLLPEKELSLKIAPLGKGGIMSVPFSRFFPNKSLSLFSSRENYFEETVKGEILLYHLLLAALMITLALGSLILYKYLTREAQLVRLKAEFVDNASHTLKTPLTRIALLAENVAQGWVTDETRKKQFFDSILSETSRMTEMIDNMLNFSKIEAQRQHYQPEKINLRETVSEIVENYRNYIANLGFRFPVRLAEHVPLVYVDPRAVQSIMGNLLQNAVKYSTDEKEIGVRLFQKGQWAVLEISDKGIGIPKKDLPQVFKKFYRVSGSNVKAIEGSGLGLYLVRHAVDAFKGQIRVESNTGENGESSGTVFQVFFPVNDAEKHESKTNTF